MQKWDFFESCCLQLNVCAGISPVPKPRRSLDSKKKTQSPSEYQERRENNAYWLPTLWGRGVFYKYYLASWQSQKRSFHIGEETQALRNPETCPRQSAYPPGSRSGQSGIEVYDLSVCSRRLPLRISRTPPPPGAHMAFLYLLSWLLFSLLFKM